MRLFAGDHLPRLAVQSGDLLRPWVMPLGLPRAHRDRLAALLMQALRALEPGLTMIQLRWAERRFLTSGRLSLPSSVLVWWRVNAVPVLDPQTVVLEGSKLTPGLSLYDFDPPGALAAEAWLGPLKMSALHRIQDRILDQRPVSAYEEVSDAIRELSAKLVSPIDLIDAAEAMVEVEAQGEGLEAAKAEAVARVIAGRFAVGPADDAVRALVAVGQKEDPGEAGWDALRKAGLADAERMIPLMDLLGDEQVVRRAVLRIAERKRLGASLAELAPRLFPENEASMTAGAIEVASMQAAVKVDAPSPSPVEPHAPVLREAMARHSSDIDAASRLVLRAVQQREDIAWEGNDLGVAGALLMAGAMNERDRLAQRMDPASLDKIAVLEEASSKLIERAGSIQVAIEVLMNAAGARNLLYQWSAAEALYEHGRDLASMIADEMRLAACYLGLAEMRLRQERGIEALADAEEAARLFHELGANDKESEALRAIGDARVQMHDFDGGRDAYEKGLALIEGAEDPTSKAMTYLSLGRLQQQKGEFKASRETIEEALSLARQHKLNLLEAQAHQALGDLAIQRNEPLRAREAYEEAARLNHEIEDRRGEASSLDRLGDVSSKSNNLAIARDAYDAALVLVRDIGDPRWEAGLLSRRGDLRGRMGDIDAAVQDYEEALRLCVLNGDRAAEARTSLMLASWEEFRDNSDVALRWNERAVVLFRQVGDLSGLAGALRRLATSLYLLGRYEEARQVGNEALRMANETKDEVQVRMLTRLLKSVDREQQAKKEQTESAAELPAEPAAKLLEAKN